MKKSVAGFLAAAMAAAFLVAGGGGSALANVTPTASGDGELTITVVNDRNLSGQSDRTAIDHPISGVTVRVVDAAGASVELVTNDEGIATLPAGDGTLSGGRYRVEVVNPDTNRYTDAQIVSDGEGQKFSPTVSFVDLSGGGVTDISVGYVDVTTLGPQNGRLYSAIQDNMLDRSGEQTEVYSIPLSLDGSQRQTHTNRLEFGTVYGVGVDSKKEDVYFGAYAKRGAAYGPGGPGAIYRYRALTGEKEQWTTVPNAGTTQHNWEANQDLDFRSVVSRESLGDVEVTKDGRFLTTVNLATDSLVVFPVQEAANPDPIQTLAVPPQDNCTADMWTPFALNEYQGGLRVGATCGSSRDIYMLDYSRAADGTLTYKGLLAKGNADRVSDRNQPNQNDANYGNDGANLVADQYINPTCRLAPWLSWSDTVGGGNAQQRVGDCVNDWSKRWKHPSTGELGEQFVQPQPLLADIDVTDSGDYVFSFRDRGSDQYGWQFLYGQQTNGRYVQGNYVATGDTVQVRTQNGQIQWAPNFNYNDGVTSNGNGVHKQGAYAGLTTVPGTNRVVGNMLDANEYFTLGLRVWDSTNGRIVNNIDLTRNFQKAVGLADLEVLVREATQQIGNRIWIDDNRDGIQTPGERPVEGVQVGLYDANGLLLATTVTDENGEYYFDTDDGIRPNTRYEVRLDRATDFQEGGPLWGYRPTQQNAGSDRGIDSNGAANSLGVVVAAVTTPAAGRNDHSIDFGFLPPLVSVGDYVWLDRNGNGVQDEGEDPIPGVEVVLYNASGVEVDRTTTGENGYYAFTNLAASTDYSVQFPTTVDIGGETYPLTQQAVGDDRSQDSNADPANGRTTFTTPVNGQNSAEPGRADDPTIDAGYTPVLVSVGDYVWIDSNRDGIQDDDERPVSGVEVVLYDADGAEVARTTTDDNGYYVFTDLRVNSEYEIVFPQTIRVDGEDYPLTQPGAGDDRARDSDPGADGRHTFTSPSSGNNSAEPGEADDPTVDAGYVSPAVSVGDFVWIDTNRDGLQDDGEPGIEGVELTLTGPDGRSVTDVLGNRVGPVRTDENGRYSFDNLPPLQSGQSYTVTVTPPPGYDPTVSGAGSDPARDSSTGSATSGDLTRGGDRDNTLDFGFVPDLVSVGDYVWIDTNKDGLQDEGEPSVAGAQVVLLDAEGNEVARTTTDDNGWYVFTDLAVDTEYTIQFPTTVEVDGQVYKPTQSGAGDDRARDSNPNAEGRYTLTTPAAGENSAEPGKADDPTIDAGYQVMLVSVGDYLWIDTNRDGIQGDGETPVSGAEVILLDANGNEVARTTTDENGYYAFTDLLGGQDYTIQFPTTVTVNDVAYPLTQQGAGDDRAADSNPGTDGRYAFTAPRSGNNSGEPGETDDPTIDAGYVPLLVSVGDYLWLDRNGNGIQDEGEAPVSGADVILLDAEGNEVARKTTGDNGYYAFPDLVANEKYTVVFPTSVEVDGVTYPLTGQGAGDDRSADSNPGEDGRYTFTAPRSGNNSAEPGEADDPSIDAGYSPQRVSVGDRVWLDRNTGGVQDEGESPVPGIEVVLQDAEGNEVARTRTNDEGYYVFPDLLANTEYTIVFPRTVTVDDVTYPLTQQGAGDDRAADSNPGADGRHTFTTPTSGKNSSEPGNTDDPTIDAGYRPAPVSVGDYVWIDLNRNGIQDEGEEPVVGAEVVLFDADGKEVARTTTDGDGYYAFPDLLAGQKYAIAFPTTVSVDDEPYVLTQASAGDDRARDSNPGDDGRFAFTAPKSGNNSTEPGQADDPTIDAGYVPVLVSVGDRVWIDRDGDGVQSENEAPVAGVEVILLDTEGNEVARTTTDDNGYYAFTNLRAGRDYTIQFPTTVPVNDVAYPLTQQGAGDDRATDSNPGADGRYSFTAPTSGSNSGKPGEADDPTIDAGYTPLRVSVGDYVWIDRNGNGVQDGSEQPVPDVAVILYDSEGNEVARTTTDDNGYYVFPNLFANEEYTIKFPTSVEVDDMVLPLTQPGEGDDRAVDSNPGENGRHTFTTPRSGSNSTEPGKADDPTIDAGYRPAPVSVGDYVWIDRDRDGLQGENEKPVAGLEMVLFDADGNELKRTTTDENGYYVFTDLLAGTEYTIQFPTTADIDGVAYPLTGEGAGDDRAKDSNPRADGRYEFTSPSSGKNSQEPGEADDPTIDAGYVPVLVSVGDFVWIDSNGDGIQGTDERPVAGIDVFLLDAEGNEVARTKTDEQGYYAFTDLIANEKYSIQFPTKVTVDGQSYPLTVPGAGDDRAADSNPGKDGRYEFVAPKSGNNSGEPGLTDDPTIDAGYTIARVSASGVVWVDKNRNSERDPDDPPAAGVVVILFDDDGNEVARTKTDGKGRYEFRDLLPKTPYTVEFPRKVTVDGQDYELPKQEDSRYKFTTPEEGGNGPGENADIPNINVHYVMKVADPAPPTSPPNDDRLPATGGTAAIGAALLALAMIIGGSVLAVVRRRASQQ